MIDEGMKNSDEGPAGRIPVSFDSIEAMLQTRVLDPPAHPGVLAAVDHFEVLRLIGCGGMGIVVLARDVRASRRVAIKLLKPELVNQDRAVHRFLVESRHMQRMSHPNILEVLEVSDRPGGPYFVMPFIEGGSLAGRIRRGQGLDFAATLRVAQQIADAIAYAHGRGIIHRDLKPGNVLIDETDRAYLADFGLVRTMYNDSVFDLRRDQCEGTAPYMSPAVAAGQAEDTRCDIYSFGAMLYELLTGETPYQGRTTEEVLQHILAGPPRPIVELNPQAHAGLVKIAEGAMARELRDRYAQMGDIVADLERVGNGKEPYGPHRHPATRSRAGIRQLAVLTIRATYLIALAGAIWAFWPLLGQYAKPPDRASTDSTPQRVSPSEAVDVGDRHRIVAALVQDNFNGTKIDPDLWDWGQGPGLSPPGQHQQFQVSQFNGTVLIDSRARSQPPWASGQDVWLDSKVDLKGAGDVLIDVALSARAINGSAVIMLCDGGSAPVRLFEAKGNRNHPLELDLSRVRIELSGSSGRATVYTRRELETELELVDVSRLSAWKLRFFVSASAADGLDEDAVQLRLYGIQAFRVRNSTSVVGRVTDVVTNRPIANVPIETSGGDVHYVAVTNAQGTYVLTPAPGTIRLHPRSTAYQPVREDLIVEALRGEQTVMDIQMRKGRGGFGDAIASVVPRRKDIRAITVRDGRMYYAAVIDKQTTLCRQPIEGEDVEVLGEAPAVRGLAWCGETLYAVGGVPGQLWRIEAKGPSQCVPVSVRKLDIDHVEDLGCDGTRLWYLECNPIDNRYGVHAIDLSSGRPAAHFVSGDIQICGIAWGQDRLWVSSQAGCVYEVDPERALAAGSLERGVAREFEGHYLRLCFWDGYLWGLDVEAERLCKIDVGSEP